VSATPPRGEVATIFRTVMGNVACRRPNVLWKCATRNVQFAALVWELTQMWKRVVGVRRARRQKSCPLPFVSCMSTLSCEQKLKTTLERFRQTAAPIHVGPIVRNMVVDMAVDEQLPGSRALQTTS
jgi:hypothetical protein